MGTGRLIIKLVCAVNAVLVNPFGLEELFEVRRIVRSFPPNIYKMWISFFYYSVCYVQQER